MHLPLYLRQGTGLGVSVLNVAVGIRVCGRVRLGGHDPGEGREGWVNNEGRMGAAMGAVACIVHVKEIENVGKDDERKGSKGKRW